MEKREHIGRDRAGQCDVWESGPVGRRYRRKKKRTTGSINRWVRGKQSGHSPSAQVCSQKRDHVFLIVAQKMPPLQSKTVIYIRSLDRMDDERFSTKRTCRSSQRWSTQPILLISSGLLISIPKSYFPGCSATRARWFFWELPRP